MSTELPDEIPSHGGGVGLTVGVAIPVGRDAEFNFARPISFPGGDENQGIEPRDGVL